MRQSAGRRFIKGVGIYIAVLLLVCWTLIPILWMAYSSVVDKAELLNSGPLALPKNLTFERYEQIFDSFAKVLSGGRISSKSEVFSRALINSVMVTLSTTALALFIGGMAAYAFARLAFKGKQFMLMLAMFIQLLPTVALIVPLYQMVKASGLIDKLPVLVVLYLSNVLAYTIWVFNGYYQSIPRDLESAARIDGCTHFDAFVRVVIPLAKPGFVAVGSLVFLMCWDELLYAMVFMNSKSTKTFTVAMSEFSDKFAGMDYPLLMTGGVLVTIIPMMLALFFQRHIVMGLTAGGVKS
ncbi:carbohydrate ABC transporter permease [Eubacteriales bacterium OttesenSCG-928-N13]|nr:carbohydrate ABC transporter permease [Eubacteriales bacterium OttesenSCG-928-N13]